MDYKNISKVKNNFTKSYYSHLDDVIIQGITFFSAPVIIEYLQRCINELSSYYDSVINGSADVFVNSIVNDALKDGQKTKD